jgi:hypothetical protein
MGLPGVFIFLQLFIFYGIPLLVLLWFVRQVRETRADIKEILERLARLEAKSAQQAPTA